MTAPTVRPTISPTTAATVMVMATPQRSYDHICNHNLTHGYRSDDRNRSSYDLGSVTDLILRLNPNRRNLLYLTRRFLTRSGTGVENERQPREAGSGAHESPVKAVVLSKEQGATSW